MKLRHTSIRFRVFLLVLIPLLATIGIYGYAVAGQFGTAAGLANAGKVSGATIRPVSEATLALSAERDAAVRYLISPSSQAMTVLQHQEAVTNRAVRTAMGVSKSGPVLANSTALEKTAAAKFVSDLGTLNTLRDEVTSSGIGATAAINQYSAIMADGVRVAEQGIQETYIGESLATTARAEVSLYTAAMLAAEENDLYSVMAADQMPAADQIEFAQLAGLRQYLVQDAAPQLSTEAASLMRHYVPASLSADITSQENLIMSARPGAATPPVPLSTWQSTVRSYAGNLVVVMTKSPAWIQSQVVSSARSALTALIVAASVGLLAVIISIVFSLVMGRRLVRRLTGLRQAALDLAHDRLPNVMGRLRAGETVDVAAEAPLAAPGNDEIDQVKEAFSVVHRTAVEAAVDEANLRRGISDVFRNLARRNQALLHRQLGLLDAMERRAEEPEQLEDLFRVDHLTTRMRRHAEGLIILSGDSPGRSWSQPVPFIDVLRAAVSEVEDYTRVKVEVRTRAALTGHAVADVVHMLAELIENATVFSPPNTQVRVQGELVGRGFAVEIEDRGLGLSDERLAEINRDLAEDPEFDLTGSDRLGLFITSRLAHRHDIKVTLRSSPFGGTTAIVIIPTSLVVPDDRREEQLALAGSPLETASLAAAGGHAGHAMIANGYGHGNGRSAGGRGDENGYAHGTQGNGNGHLATDAPASDLFTPRHSADSSILDDSGWWTRPTAASWRTPESAETGYATNGATGAAPPEDSIPGGLPVRVPQASLAPQLRDPGAYGDDAVRSDTPPPSAKDFRNSMSALQRGWERGRSATAGPYFDADPRDHGGQ
jgi:signal transduction histidine kinase